MKLYLVHKGMIVNRFWLISQNVQILIRIVDKADPISITPLNYLSINVVYAQQSQYQKNTKALLQLHYTDFNDKVDLFGKKVRQTIRRYSSANLCTFRLYHVNDKTTTTLLINHPSKCEN